MSKYINLLFCIITNLNYANPLHVRVSTAFTNNDINLNNVSISVVYIGDSKDEILAFNDKSYKNPASTMKILTSVAALDILKPDYSWKTRFFSDNSYKNHGNSLDGNIYVDLQGEPKFVPEVLLPMLYKWKDDGIDSLNANFVLDNSVLSSSPDSSSDDNTNEVYATKPRADNFSFNSISLKFNAKDVGFTYPVFGFNIKNNLILTGDSCPSNKSWGSNIAYTVSNSGNSYTINLNGKYSSECFDKSLNIPISHIISNKDFFVNSVLGLWQSIGGKVLNEPKVSYGKFDSKNKYMIGEVSGFPLSSLIYDVNKFSNNLMARLIFLRLGTKYQSYDLNAGLSTRVMLNYLRENKIDTSGITFENGCGLSQIERISAKQMTDILALAYTKPFFKVFLDSLPLVGIDGTMKNRLHDISGMASLKTGTLNNVRAIAGYISDGKGGYFAISAMVNSENANKSSPALDELVRWVASYELSK
ncbi:MAG: hypothetical protein RLZZ210_1159 [Pseudomonadota bacterium]